VTGPTFHASPAWMSAEQAEAFARGTRHAEAAASAATAKIDGRIALDDVVSFRPPSFLTVDYDPTYRPAVR
jgi:hypothetical protein